MAFSEVWISPVRERRFSAAGIDGSRVKIEVENGRIIITGPKETGQKEP